MRIRMSPAGEVINPTSPQPPANYGYSTIAQKEIDNVISAANAKYEEAMQVDGVEFLLWRKTKSGHVCSCQGNSSLVNSDIRREISSENQHQNRTKSTGIRVRGSWDRQETIPNTTGKELGVTIGEIESDRGNTNDIKRFDQINDQEDEAWFNSSDLQDGFLFGGPTVACGICFGTKYSDGYSLYRGKRVVFDAVNYKTAKIFVQNSNTRPISFSVQSENKDAYVEWEYEFPTFFLNFISFAVRNNTRPAYGVHLLYRLQGTSDPFALFTKTFANSRQNIPTRVVFRVVPNNLDKTTTIDFTHIEMVWQFAPWPKTQIAQLQESTTFQTVEPVSQMEFPLPPSIDMVRESDIIFEMKYGKVWSIADVTDFMTAKRQVLSWSVQARSLTSFDMTSLLKIPYEPNYAISYKGLEHNPGSIEFGNDNI